MSQTIKTILAVLITAIIVGGTVYWYTNSQQNEPVIEQPESITESENQKKEDAESLEETTMEESEMSFVSCSESLYFDNRDQYDAWEAKFSELYPNLRVYDAGAYCKLNNGNQLISFSHFPTNGEVSGAGQTIILFDENDNVLKATENFYCQTMGDLGYPVFKSLKNNKVIMTCSSADAAYFLKSTYELDLDTFEFRLINKDTSLPE